MVWQLQNRATGRCTKKTQRCARVNPSPKQDPAQLLGHGMGLAGERLHGENVSARFQKLFFLVVGGQTTDPTRDAVRAQCLDGFRAEQLV